LQLRVTVEVPGQQASADGCASSNAADHGSLGHPSLGAELPPGYYSSSHFIRYSDSERLMPHGTHD